VKPFDYYRAADLTEAAATHQPGSVFIAGGTNLVDLMKLQVMTPDRVIDIARLGLDRIEDDGDGLRIGALVSNSDLAADPRVRKRWPVLSRALLAGASGQLRNKATTGGNLLQRTRCPYFQDLATPCNKRTPGSGCAAMGGELRNHAVLGTSAHCLALNPGDMAVALRALDAVVEFRDAQGIAHAHPIAGFHLPPGTTPDVETVLPPGALITSVALPAPKGDRQIYRKVRDRASYAFALVSVAAVLRLERGRIVHAALAFGGLGTVPWRDPAVDALLTGEAPSMVLFDKAADLLLHPAQPREGTAFKLPLTRRLLRAVLEEATQ